MSKKDVVRPKIKREYVQKIKNKYPKETAMLNYAQTITWALDKFLSFQELKVE